MAQSLHFGFEIELLIKDTAWIKHKKDWVAVATSISQSLARKGVRAHLTSASKTKTETYEEWAISPELAISVDAAKQKHHYGIELVSPVYLNMEDGWGKQLPTIFNTIGGTFAISNTSTTGTHIHVSTAPYFSAIDVASIAKAAIYFEPALDRLVPEKRRENNNHWAQSLLKSIPLANTSGILDQWATIDKAAGTGSVLSVIETVNLVSKNSPRGIGMRATQDFIHGKVFKWNFTPLVQCSDGRETPLETIEFRQPSGSMNAVDVAQWAFLAVAFVQAAISGGMDHVDGSEKRNRKELWMFIEYGAKYLPVDSDEVRGFKSWILESHSES